MSGPSNSQLHNETLFELAQWLARVQQYSASHPACAQLGERTHRALLRSLGVASPLAVDIQKDGMSVDGAPATHPAVRDRLAPYLHERGVQVLRFATGTTVEELTGLIELLTVPVQSTFDRGGLRHLATERGLARIQIEELAHDISADERAAQRVRGRLRDRFGDALRDVLARRSLERLNGEELHEMLEHPEMAVTILEEDPLGILESLAALCMMVKNEEQRLAADLFPKLRDIILALAPPAHDRVLLGLPTLVGELRESLAWALSLLSDDELGRVALASFRAHATELHLPLYALSVAAPLAGRRIATLRRMSMRFYDLPADDPSASELVMVCALNDGDVDSYWTERDVLSEHALGVLGGRGNFMAKGEPVTPETDTPRTNEDERSLGTRRVVSELVTMSSRTRRFEQLAAKLPEASVTLARAGATEGILGILDGLRAVRRPEWRELAGATLRASISPAVAAQILADVDAHQANAEGPPSDDVLATLKLLTALAPEVVLGQLELSESRKMRRILIENLSAAGPRILPLVREKLHSPSWFMVRNALLLLPRVGGTVRDLLPVVGHDNEKVRLEVVRVLRTLPMEPLGMQFVAAYLTDPWAEVRQHAAVMLRGELLTPEAVARLERVALDEEQPEDLRRRVVDALGRCPHDVAATALFGLLQPRGLIEVASLRDDVAVALRHSRAPRAAQYFAEGLRSNAWRVRKACERALTVGPPP